MRKMGLGIAVVVSSLFGVASAAPAFRWQASGSGAAVVYDNVSADGCVETVGTAVFMNAPEIGQQGITLGQTIDYCTLDADGNPTTSFFFGGGAIAYAQNGLSSASALGTITATDFFSGASITLEFDLAFAGSGSTTTTTSHWTSTAGGVTLSFNSQRHRSATASGTFTIDGDDATLSDGQLFNETAGELVVLTQ